MSYSYKMSKKGIFDGIPKLAKTAKSLRLNVHKIGVSILVNWNAVGDVRSAVKQADMLVKDVDQRYSQAIVNWFSAHTPLQWRQADKENGLEAGFFYENKATTITIEQVQKAKSVPWYEFTKPANPKPYDFVNEVQALLDRAMKRASNSDKEGFENDTIPNELHNRLSKVLSEYKQETTPEPSF